jgi:phage gpG-like protein
MAFVSIEIEGERELLAAFEKLTARQSDMAWAWPKIATEFYDIEQRWFASEGNGSWPALSPTYAATKEISYPGQPVLHATGALERSLTSQADENAIYDPQPDELTLGTRLARGAYHQRGAGSLPKRPPIELSRANAEAMRDIAADQFRTVGREIGFEVYA